MQLKFLQSEAGSDSLAYVVEPLVLLQLISTISSLHRSLAIRAALVVFATVGLVFVHLKQRELVWLSNSAALSICPTGFCAAS